MAGAVPKTKATAIADTLKAYGADHFLTDFMARKHLAEIDAALKTGVDVGELWICKGMVEGLRDNPDKMMAAFQNSKNLGEVDHVSRFNRAYLMGRFGLFSEAIEEVSVCSKNDDSVKELIMDYSMSMMDFETLYKYVDDDFYLNLARGHEHWLKSQDVPFEQIKAVLHDFLNILRLRKVRFTLFESAVEDGNSLKMHFIVNTSMENVLKILQEFDDLTTDETYFQASMLLNLVLTPDLNLVEV